MSALGGRARRLALVSLLAFAIGPAGARAAAPSPAAQSRRVPSRPVTARADTSATARRQGAGSRSPTGPPLTSARSTSGGDEAEASSEGASTEADPLVSNGLGSPSCHGALGGGALSARERGDCETSGFVAAAAPTGDFGLDVHIDTGLLGLSSGGLLASVEDLCVTPLWMALVWAVHALVVMLEWCFTIDLLERPSVQLGLARGLRAAQAAFTVPWLAAALAVAATTLAYDGLVRRRIGESLGRALLAMAMTAAAFWVMLDPSGTIGALGEWANEASLGTLAVTARGSPGGAEDALDGAMGTAFAAVVEGPWCYLEFGDVGWCRDPRRLDPQLHAAALALAVEEAERIGCGSGGVAAGECVAAGGADASALGRSARLLRAARTNGAIFLALPANGAGRNSINDSWSLLRAICRAEDATRCRGPSASEAEFRTNRGTWPRVGGLVLIVAGALGMLLLFGFLALRLLSSALFAILYLLLAPLVALAPALGESGRAIFRRWGSQLLGAVVAKLLFSFVLGAVLAVLGILAGLEALGWWTQWLLMSAFWWAAFLHRHQALALAGARGERAADGRPIGRRSGAARRARRRVLERARVTRERHRRRQPEDGVAGARRDRRTPRPIDGTRTAQATDRTVTASDPQVGRVVEAEAREARAHEAASGVTEARVTAMQARLGRVRREQVIASTTGDWRRAARLTARGDRIEAELDGERSELDRATRAEPADGRGESAGTPAQRRRERARFLDAQAALPAAAARGAGVGISRDYAALAGLAGHAPREYERLEPREQRVARVAIDRELAVRRERLITAPAAAVVAAERGAPVPWREPRANRPARPRASESTVMSDARAVAERRKRQLGTGRP